MSSKLSSKSQGQMAACVHARKGRAVKCANHLFKYLLLEQFCCIWCWKNWLCLSLARIVAVQPDAFMQQHSYINEHGVGMFRLTSSELIAIISHPVSVCSMCACRERWHKLLLPKRTTMCRYHY